MHPYRTHTCNELRASDAGKTVRLSGWMFRLRDHGGILFVDLRDHYGITQIVVHPSRSFFGLVEKAHLESVITVTGEVKLRTPDTINPELPTGEIEIEANELVMESASQVTPLYIPDEKAAVARDILEALPEWFEVESSREKLIAGSRDWLCLAEIEDGRPLGFLCLKETGRATVEVAVMGVLKACHRRGIGRRLVEIVDRLRAMSPLYEDFLKGVETVGTDD